MKRKAFTKLISSVEVSKDKKLTVKELIDTLRKYPEDYVVQAICYREGSLTGGCEGDGFVEKVDLSDFNTNVVNLTCWRR